MKTNVAKWTLAVGLGFLCGAISALTDDHVPSMWDVCRHGLFGILPTICSLQLTLKKDLGIGQ